MTPALLVALSVGAGASGCTGDDEPEAEQPRPSPTATEAAPELSQRPAPYRVRLATVAGHIPKAGRATSLRRLSAPVRAWVGEAFVEGPWPRGRFAAAYAPFGKDTARRVRRSADLLTLRSHGARLEHVVPERRWITVSATAVRGRVVGATARVNLRFLGLLEDESRVRVHVRGDVYLTRTRSHRWKIFGYDLDRWEERGAMTARGSGGAETPRGGDG